MGIPRGTLLDTSALELLLGSVNDGSVVVPALHDVDMNSSSTSARFGTRPITMIQLLRPLKQLLHLDADTTHQMWVITFTAIWRVLSRKEQGDTHKSLVSLLAKDYHTRQLVLRRNVIQSLLAGVLNVNPHSPCLLLSSNIWERHSTHGMLRSNSFRTR